MIAIDWNPPARQLRQFGWFALIGFPLIGLVLLGQVIGAADWLAWTVSAVGPVTLLLALVEPKLVKPIYFGLMMIALPIGITISWLLLALIFYGLFTPVGLLFRLLGRDPLPKRPDPSIPSYWHDRGQPRAAASYLRLY